jgi:putative membrane protein
MLDTLPHLTAMLNACCATLLFLGWRAQRGQRLDRHRALMSSAFLCSVLFLVVYLTRVTLAGTHRYDGEGWDRTLYLVLLSTHMVLAAIVPVLAIRTLFLALKQRIDDHRRWARVTFPIWMYVSVSGVVVYWMLHHL